MVKIEYRDVDFLKLGSVSSCHRNKSVFVTYRHGPSPRFSGNIKNPKCSISRHLFSENFKITGVPSCSFSGVILRHAQGQNDQELYVTNSVFSFIFNLLAHFVFYCYVVLRQVLSGMA